VYFYLKENVRLFIDLFASPALTSTPPFHLCFTAKVFGAPQSWDVFETLEKEPWALEHMKRITHDFSPEERGRAFLKVCLKYNWVADICQTLSKSTDTMEYAECYLSIYTA